MARPPTVLTISATDPTGADGVEADLKTLSALGTHGMAVVTGFAHASGFQALTPAQIVMQLEALFAAATVDAVKTGALASVDAVSAVAALLRQHHVPILIVDPVLPDPGASANGSAAMLHALRQELLPLATIVTPNLPEAIALAGRPIDTWDDARAAADAICGLGAAAVVIKGGRRPGDVVTDLLYDGTDFREYSTPRVEAADVAGTGTSFATAIAATLAKQETVQHSIAAAKAYVTKGLQSAYDLGAARRSLHHFYRYWHARGR